MWRTTLDAGYPILAFVLAASALAGCSRSATTAVSPSGVKCQVGVSAPADVLESAGAMSSVSITAQPECAWSASSEAAWIAVQTPVSGQGNGKVDFRVLANPSAAAREGALVLNEQRLTVRQRGAACRWEVTPQSRTVGASSTTAALGVNTLPGCAWTAASDVPWITITSGASGDGPGEVSYQLSANAGEPRSGHIIVADQSVLFAQAAGAAPVPGCQLSVSPTEFAVTSAERLIAVDVMATAGCAWTAVSSEPWLSVRSAPSTTGSGVVSIAIAANSGVPRSGMVTVAGRAVVVTQAGGCAVAFAPANLTVGNAGGDLTATVTAPVGCVWTAATADAWLKVISGSPGSANGVLTLSALPNSGTARSGAVYIAGQPLTVTQEGSCDSSIDPVTQSIGISGGPGTAAVIAPAGCAWTAKSNDGWITLTSGAAGAGAGSVAFMVAPNSGPARTGTLTIAGRTFSITQGTNCSFAVAPSTVSVPLGGGTGGPISVTTAAGCTWTAVSGSSWLTVTSGAAGTGSGSVSVSATANSAGSRTGTLTIAGQTVTVSQGGGCSFAVAPLTLSVPLAGGNGGPIAVTTAPGCAWTAVSGSSWLTISSGATGSGNGTVSFSATANAAGSRTGTLTVAGQTVTVSQGDGCSVTAAPALVDNLPATAGAGPAIAVTAAAGCAWTATSAESWVRLTGNAAGVGNGSVTFTVEANTGSVRQAAISIAGQTVIIKQQGSCDSSIAPGTQSIGSSGGPGTVAVTAPAGCTWTAKSNDSWITLTSAAAGSGAGSAAFTVAANNGPARTGTLTIAGQTLSVLQAPGCSFSVAPSALSLPIGGGSGGPINVTTVAGCAWTAVSGSTWLTITSGATGAGNGTVTLSAVANTGGPRTGSLTVAGTAVTVSQAGTCTVTVSPTLIEDLPNTAGPGPNITVTAPAGCAWTAVSSDSWVRITSSATGSGNGIVTFSVEANQGNPGKAREAAITIAGQTVTIKQVKK